MNNTQLPVLLNLEPLGYSPYAKQSLKPYFAYNEAKEFDLVTLPEDTHTLIVRLGNYIGKEIFDRLTQLKFVVSATTGLDHIDLAEAERRNIQILSLRGETEFLETITSTPELTWGLLLALVRNIPSAIASVDKGEWDRDSFRGYQLSGRTIGIVGLGRTGKMVAQYAEAFGMKVSYYDPYVSVNKYEKTDTLEELLSISDVVSLHVHLSKETHHLINAKNLKYIKEGSWLLNTSRGGICDGEALVEALKTGILQGIATDVLAGELTDFTQSALYQARKEGYNVLITPHIGGASFDAMRAAEEFMAAKLLKTLNYVDCC